MLESLKSLTSNEKYVVFCALSHGIHHGLRVGFHNQDTGHPDYCLDANGEADPSSNHADGPNKNILYKLMHEITMAKDGGEDITISDPINTWTDFCRLISKANEANRKPNEK